VGFSVSTKHVILSEAPHCGAQSKDLRLLLSGKDVSASEESE